jgi:hypothetical protein
VGVLLPNMNKKAKEEQKEEVVQKYSSESDSDSHQDSSKGFNTARRMTKADFRRQSQIGNACGLILTIFRNNLRV